MGESQSPMRAVVLLVLLAAVGCTLATGVEDDSSAHLVVQLAEDTMVVTNLIQIAESKIQSKKQVDAAVKKHGSPEQASKGAKAMKEMHDRMEKLEKKLDQVHTAVGAGKKKEEKPKSKSTKVRKAQKKAEKARENAKDCEKKAKKAEKKAKKVEQRTNGKGKVKKAQKAEKKAEDKAEAAKKAVKKATKKAAKAITKSVI